MRSTRTGWLLAATVCVLLAACTSSTGDGDDDTAGTGDGGSGSGSVTGAGNTQGITDSTIKVSLIWADLAQLTEQNLAPEIGSAGDMMQAVVDDVNADGGVAGRQIELVSHVLNGADAILNPDLGRQACVEATEDDEPFAVFIAASIPADLVQCTAVDHDVLTITMDSWPSSLYEAAEGRLFSVGSHISIERNRLYQAWPGILDDAGLLDGTTIGVIRTDQPEAEETTDEALIPALEDLGYDVAAEAVLPCPEGSQTCEQQDVAIQKMQDANVDVVFLTAQTLAGSATVEAAQNLGFKPQWMTIGNNTTDTVAKFYANAKDNFDGAYGLDVNFHDFTPEAAACNEIAVDGGAEKFPDGSDGYGFTAVTCMQLQTLAQAVDAVSGDLDQAAVISALQDLDPISILSGPAGSLSADKHDVGRAVFLSRYSADTQTWEAADGEKPVIIGD